MLVLVGIALYIFWPRGHVMLPLVPVDDPVFEVFSKLPCRGELPSDTRVVVRFYDDGGIPMPDRIYTLTPVSVHEGQVGDYDVLFRTGWYWVANAKVDWCETARTIKDHGDYSVSSEFNINSLRFGGAKDCFQELCKLT